MQLRGPKRIYHPQALEFWFGKLAVNWEEHFSETVLHLARNWYREGAIRELELGVGEAIIHTKLEGRACYSVIEWDDSRTRVRSSVEEKETGHAIAAAGLYEIEELVADEISPLAEDTLSRNGSGEKPAPAVEIRQTSRPPRPLCLRFDISGQRLCFEAFWQESSGRERAMLNGGGGNGSLNDAEREKLIRLASLARKARFGFEKKANAYFLEELARIPAFIGQDLPAWRRHFTVEMMPGAERIFEGIREVGVRLEAREAGNGNGAGGLNLKWIFRSGEKQLPKKEAEKLLGNKGGPVFLPEFGLVELPRKKYEVVRAWQREGIGGNDLENRRYLLFSLFNAEGTVELRLSPEIKKWSEGFRKEPPLLSGLPDCLRPYQKKGVSWMAHLLDHGCHALLADEMGLGKTLQVIALIARRPTEEKRHLVVGPASVIPVWENEWKRFQPEMPVHVLRAGSELESEAAQGIWLASYTQLRLQRELIKDIRFGYAVLDEGQFIKNPNSKAAQACYAVNARHRLVLTGTPLENRQLDLWSLFRYLMPELLGSRSNFERAVQEDREGSFERLRVQIAPFVMRRTKGVVATELPPKVETTLAAPLGEVQKREYALICAEGIQRLRGDASAGRRVGDRSFALFSLLTRLRQVCCDPDLLPWMSAPLEESGKILLLMEKLPEILEAGHKVVVFSQFVRLLERIDRALAGAFPEIPRFSLNGSTRHRDRPVADFQKHEGAGVILVSLRAGGTGITLHAADYVFLLDPWWNPAVEEQAIDRVHRIGQTNAVFVYRILTAGTIEERISDLKWTKQEIFRNIIGRIDGVGSLEENLDSLSQLIGLRDPSG